MEKEVRRMFDEANDWERIKKRNKTWIRELREDPHKVWERKFGSSREEKKEEKEERKW